MPLFVGASNSSSYSSVSSSSSAGGLAPKEAKRLPGSFGSFGSSGADEEEESSSTDDLERKGLPSTVSESPPASSSASSSSSELPPKGFLKLNAAATTVRDDPDRPITAVLTIESFRDDATGAAAGRRLPATTRAGAIARATGAALTIIALDIGAPGRRRRVDRCARLPRRNSVASSPRNPAGNRSTCVDQSASWSNCLPVPALEKSPNIKF